MLRGKFYKRIAYLLIIGLALCGCSVSSHKKASEKVYYEFTDDLKHSIVLTEKPQKVVSLLGSYGEIWALSGGELIGITEDAISERGLELGANVQIVGTVKAPNLEKVLELSPDFVLLSTDIEAHVKFAETLKKANIPYAFFKVDQFADYMHMLKICTDITNRQDLYKEYGTKVQLKINAVLNQVNDNREKPSVLLIRTMSTKAKALKEDHMTGKMLNCLKTINIASKQPSLLEELSMETIIKEDPDFIFVITMGDRDKALQTLEKGIKANPAWNNLSAVKNGHFYVLPKELFHYKPNAKWGKSYEYLEKILYQSKS